MPHLGTGIGWRPEIAHTVEELPGLDWVEVVAENIRPGRLPDSLRRLRSRGTTVVPHGVSLGIGGPERPAPDRLAALAERAEALGAPLVTEHIAFVRAGGPGTGAPRLEAGHLLPVPRTRDALDVLCENVRTAQDALPVPLALENIAALVRWPDEEMTEGRFLAELVERTGVRLLIDVANLHTNHVNRGEDPAAVLDALPPGALAYVHVAGGVERDGVWHDSHAHPVPPAVLGILADLLARAEPPGVLLERDDNFPEAAELARELDAIRAVTAAPRPAPSRPAGVPGTAGPRPERRDRTAVESAGGARTRVAAAQTALLSALVAGGPVPAGFDPERLRVQSRALAAKRADVVAKVAPELPDILGARYRPAFLAYARLRPLSGGHRWDALHFAEHVLAQHVLAEHAAAGEPLERPVRRALARWHRERSGPAPGRGGRAARLLRAQLGAFRRAQASPATSSETGLRRPV
ncbi:DUF692 domain-containing protein [Streptomyces sp. Ru87]|uniref:DUF692 domain-containing protein n=1 Tax=Streptomyces sp. Ru87 TaxID=2044307 RepID=UPI000BF487CE|nr:DUF692 domain-containing protein [Streptomyces sp. Ru87]PGH48042.1 endonuclease [Streptomyces sp. Ru87]